MLIEGPVLEPARSPRSSPGWSQPGRDAAPVPLPILRPLAPRPSPPAPLTPQGDGAAEPARINRSPDPRRTFEAADRRYPAPPRIDVRSRRDLPGWAARGDRGGHRRREPGVGRPAD